MRTLKRPCSFRNVGPDYAGIYVGQELEGGELVGTVVWEPGDLLAIRDEVYEFVKVHDTDKDYYSFRRISLGKQQEAL